MKHNKKRSPKRTRHQLKRRYQKSLREKLIKELLLLSKKNIDDMVSFIPLLSNEDTLFSESDAVNDAMLNTTQSRNDILIQNGYISVSVLLMNIVEFSQSNLVKDSYIYPALFCFRQYLEITMKKAILKYRDGDTNPYKGESKFKTHDIENLWEKLIKHIKLTKM